MSEDRSARLALPLLHPGQAQKEMDHNEALAIIDIALQPAVAAVGMNHPPSDPAEGECWIVGNDPDGDWTDHAGALAGWTAGGWRFLAPCSGMAVWSIADGCAASHVDGQWTIGQLSATRLTVGGIGVVGAQQAAIADPTGGAMIDVGARDAIAAMLGALRAHGLIAA